MSKPDVLMEPDCWDIFVVSIPCAAANAVLCYNQEGHKRRCKLCTEGSSLSLNKRRKSSYSSSLASLPSLTSR